MNLDVSSFRHLGTSKSCGLDNMSSLQGFSVLNTAAHAANVQTASLRALWELISDF